MGRLLVACPVQMLVKWNEMSKIQHCEMRCWWRLIGGEMRPHKCEVVPLPLHTPRHVQALYLFMATLTVKGHPSSNGSLASWRLLFLAWHSYINSKDPVFFAFFSLVFVISSTWTSSLRRWRAYSKRDELIHQGVILWKGSEASSPPPPPPPPTGPPFSHHQAEQKADPIKHRNPTKKN